jgi:non-heme chloroperoxidase
VPYVKTLDETRLFYAEWGKGRPVVFSHGYGINGDMWNYQIPDIAAAGYRCVIFDRRGHGRSDRPAVGYEMDVFADDLSSVVDYLDLSDAILVGHSMGGGEIVRYLTRHGSARVAGVVLSAPATPLVLKAEDNPSGIDPESLEASWALLKRDVGAFLAAFTASGPNYWGVDHAVSSLLSSWTIQQFVNTPPAILIATNKAFAYADYRNELREIEVPTLVIHGDADGGGTPLENGRRTAALIPDSRLVVIPGAGHGVYASQAERYNSELLAFLSSLAGGG